MDWHVECEGIWKIFGSDEKSALKKIRDEALDKHGTRRKLDHIVAVADVSLQIRRGELFCIMGLSGSGKSTLLRHVNRLIEPTAGRILVDGVDTMTMDKKALRRLRSTTISMVFQHMALWPHRTLLENVAYGLEIQGVEKEKRWRVASDMLALMKLEGWDSRYPDELSGGMQQRVGLARALAPDPDVLLMDEPFSALDPIIRRDLQTQFLELANRMHKTTLFVTHDLEEAIRLGDRIAIMKDGELVQVGTPEEIVLNPVNDYVADFVGPMSKGRFLRADQVMVPVAGAYAGRQLQDSVSCDANLQEILEKVAKAREPIGVADGGAVIGLIDAYSLLGAMSRTNTVA